MERILNENSNDVRFFFHIEHLLLVIYEHALKGKYISKSQACRLIPVGHMNTCKRYVEEAEQRGFVKFEIDKEDARRVSVIPTEELTAYVHSKMESAIDEARQLVGAVAERKMLPKDNLPLSQYPK